MARFKRCTGCGESDPKQFYRNRANADGLHSECKKCTAAQGRAWREANKDRKRESAHAYYEANKPATRARVNAWTLANPKRKGESRIEKEYGVTPERFAEMFKEQDGRCALCFVPFSEKKWHGPHVDHNHDTGEVRGLLCRGCNAWLGRYERPGFPEAAQEYLARETQGVEA